VEERVSEDHFLSAKREEQRPTTALPCDRTEEGGRKKTTAMQEKRETETISWRKGEAKVERLLPLFTTNSEKKGQNSQSMPMVNEKGSYPSFKN